MLSLNRTELATAADDSLVRWAKLFQAATWEELKSLSQSDIVMQEVSEVMYDSIIYQSQEQTIMEGHERFLAMKRAMYRNGYEDAKEEDDKIISEKDAFIENQNARIAIQDARIAELEAQLAALKK